MAVLELDSSLGEFFVPDHLVRVGKLPLKQLAASSGTASGGRSGGGDGESGSSTKRRRTIAVSAFAASGGAELAGGHRGGGRGSGACWPRPVELAVTRLLRGLGVALLECFEAAVAWRPGARAKWKASAVLSSSIRDLHNQQSAGAGAVPDI